MLVQPYLFFEGRAEEALTFYKTVFGAEEVMLMRFSDSPEPTPEGMMPPGSENKVMHMSFRIGESLIMGSDGNCGGAPNFKGVTLSVEMPDEVEADRVFNALEQGGTVQMPLGKTFFSPRFGMVADQFGVSWMIIVPGETAA